MGHLIDGAINTPAQSNPNEGAMGYTADDLAKAREQEKAKLYPQLEKMREELASLKREREEEAANRAAAIAAKEAAEAAALRAKEEEELSAKELLAKKEQEWNARLEQESLERERAFALLEKERKFQEVMNYRAFRIEEERETIAPQLLDMISGNSEEEIEQSISLLKEKTALIMQDVQQTVLNQRQQMVGARITAPASGPLDNESDQHIATPDSVRDMSLADYAKNRAKLLGSAASNRGQGLFG